MSRALGRRFQPFTTGTHISITVFALDMDLQTALCRKNFRTSFTTKFRTLFMQWPVPFKGMLVWVTSTTFRTLYALAVQPNMHTHPCLWCCGVSTILAMYRLRRMDVWYMAHQIIIVVERIETGNAAIRLPLRMELFEMECQGTFWLHPHLTHHTNLQWGFAHRLDVGPPVVLYLNFFFNVSLRTWRVSSSHIVLCSY